MAEVPLPTPTQVPVPSTDIRNAVFAGAKLDEEVTGTGEFYTDRLGVNRLTNTGRNNQFSAAQQDRTNQFQQFLLSSGYVFLGDYEDGPFQFSARNQYIRYSNQYYRLNAVTDVGFITTGTTADSFANDVTHFVLMDGDTLRQELASPSGASLSGAAQGGSVEKALHFITVKQKGAVGDGVTVEDSYFTKAAKEAPASNIAGVGKSADIPRPDSCIVYVNDGEYLLNDYLDVGNRDVTWVLSHGAKIINPRYLNGRVQREGRQTNFYPHGSAGYVCGFSTRSQKLGEDPTDGPEILGITTPSRLASYPDRDVAAIYGEVKLPQLITTLTGTTFTANSVVFTSTLTANARKFLRVGMIIDTLGTKYSGIITGWSPDWQTIYVSGWYLYGGGVTPVTPTNGLSAVINAFTKGWGLNVNVQIDTNSYGDYAVAAEFGVINNKAYNQNVWGVDVVNLGTYKMGTLHSVRGGVNGSLYGVQIRDVDTAININNVTNAYFIGVDNNDVQMTFGKNTQTFGKASTASTQTIAFRTSGLKSGGNDATITVSGGDATALATINMVASATITRHLNPHADGVDDLGFAGAGRFRNAYLVNAPIVTSDSNMKTGSEDGSVDSLSIPDAVLDAWESINPWVIYKMKASVAEKGWESARWHIGAISQAIKAAFEKHGIDAMDYGLIGYDEWPAEEAVYSEYVPEVNIPEVDIPERHLPAEVDENGVVTKDACIIPAYHQEAVFVAERTPELIKPAIEAGSCYSLRYEECLSLEAACLRRKIKRIEDKLNF